MAGPFPAAVRPASGDSGARGAAGRGAPRRPRRSPVAGPRRSSRRPRACATPASPARGMTRRRRSGGPGAAGSCLLHPVALPVPGGDVLGSLVPVPRARVLEVILRRIARVDGEPGPLHGLDLVHERAVRAVQREVLTVVGPVVGLARAAEALALVGAVAHQALPRAARVHHKSDLLVVLGDRDRAGVLADAGGGVGPPRRGQQRHEILALEAVDRLDVALPAALVAERPGVADALVAEAVLDEADQ